MGQGQTNLPCHNSPHSCTYMSAARATHRDLWWLIWMVHSLSLSLSKSCYVEHGSVSVNFNSMFVIIEHDLIVGAFFIDTNMANIQNPEHMVTCNLLLYFRQTVQIFTNGQIFISLFLISLFRLFLYTVILTMQIVK